MRRTRLLKFILHLLLRLGYRYEVKGIEHAAIIKPGAKVLVVVNHVSFLDGALLMAALSEIPVFAINTQMANRWWLRPFRKVANLYPLDPTNPLAIKELIGRINGGHPCVIFPEGRLSVTGALMKIYAGPAYIADRTGATILPVRLDGPELTPFSRLKQGQVKRHWFPKVTITVCPPTRLTSTRPCAGRSAARSPTCSSTTSCRTRCSRTADWGPTLFAALLRARWRHGWRYPVLEDTSGARLNYTKLVAGALVLGRRFAAVTEPGERVGVLLPNVNAAAVVFYALQAFGRVPAMLNFSAGPANLEAAAATAQLKLVISSSEFVAKAKLEPSIAAIGGHATFLWLEDLRGQVGTVDRLRGLLDGLFAARIHAASASSATTRPWSCSPRARRAGPRASCSATATSWPTAPRSRPGSTSTSSTRCSTPCRCSTASASPAPCSCRPWAASRSTCTPRRCTTGSSRSWSTPATPRSSSAPTASSRATAAWATPTTSAPCATRWPAPSRSRTRPRGCGSTSSACASSAATAPPRPRRCCR